jgi:hypothetical protein
VELNAKIQKSLTQIRIFKQLETGAILISRKNAKHAFESGKVTKYNKCFARLAENDFDVKATLAWYQEERERIARDKARAGTSSTDEA